jgi:translation initiation factor 4G
LADAEDNSRAVIDGLKLEIAALTERIVRLDATGKFWFERERESQSAVSRLTSAERDARLALDEVKEGARLALCKAKEEARIALDMAKEEARVALDKAKEEARIALDKANEEARLTLNKAEEGMRLANQRLEELRSEYDALKSRWVTRTFSC